MHLKHPTHPERECVHASLKIAQPIKISPLFCLHMDLLIIGARGREASIVCANAIMIGQIEIEAAHRRGWWFLTLNKTFSARALNPRVLVFLHETVHKQKQKQTHSLSERYDSLTGRRKNVLFFVENAPKSFAFSDLRRQYANWIMVHTKMSIHISYSASAKKCFV